MQKNQTRGASLVEAVVAMALLSMLILFVCKPLSAADRATAQVSSRRAALNLACEIMDRAQSCSPKYLVSDQGEGRASVSSATGQISIAYQWRQQVTTMKPGCYWLKIEVALPTGQPVILESQRVCLGAGS